MRFPTVLKQNTEFGTRPPLHTQFRVPILFYLQKPPKIRSKFGTTEIGTTEFGTTEIGTRAKKCFPPWHAGKCFLKMVAFSTHKFGATEFGTTEIGTKEIGTLVNRTSHCAFPVPLAQNNKSKSGTTGSCRTEFGTMLSLVLPDSVTLQTKYRIRYETSTAQQISRS